VLKVRPHHSHYEDEVDPLTEDDPTTARLDLLSAYTMFGTLQLDGLLAYSARAEVEEAAPIVEPPALEDDGYYYKEPGEHVWTAS
jgi:hypothetical protein